MTRLLCCADLHLGAGASMLPPGERLKDQEQVLDRIADLADEREVDAILIAGDVFHRPRPTPEELHVFRRFERRLDYLPILACNGNAGHDLEGDGRPSALELFANRHLAVHSAPGLWRHRESSDAPTVGTLPSVPIGRLVAALPDTSRDELYAMAAELLIGQAAELRSQGARILMAHWTVSGGITATGHPAGPDFGVVLPLAELQALGFDAVILGHLHAHQVLSEDPFIAYCSTPIAKDFGEEHGRHGIWILDIEGGATNREYIEIPSRPLVTLDVDFTDGYDFSMLLEGYEPFVSTIREGGIYRVRYTASEEQARRISQHEIRAALIAAGAAAVTFDPTILRATRARGEGITQAATLLDQVDLYLDANPLPDGRGERVRDLIRSLTTDRQGALL